MCSLISSRLTKYINVQIFKFKTQFKNKMKIILPNLIQHAKYLWEKLEFNVKIEISFQIYCCFWSYTTFFELTPVSEFWDYSWLTLGRIWGPGDSDKLYVKQIPYHLYTVFLYHFFFTSKCVSHGANASWSSSLSAVEESI